MIQSSDGDYTANIWNMLSSGEKCIIFRQYAIFGTKQALPGVIKNKKLDQPGWLDCMVRNYLCSTREQVEELASSWDDFQTFLDAPVTKYDWIISCVDNLLGNSSLYMPVVCNSEKPVAVAPLVKPRGFFSAVRQIGAEEHGEPEDFLYDNDDSLEKLSTALARDRIPLLLMRVPELSPVVQAITLAYTGKAFIYLRPQVSCPFIDIKAGEQQTIDSLPSRLRSDLRRAQRKAEALGQVSYEIHSPCSLGELTPLWDESLKVEAAGWKGRSRTALAEDQGMASFFLSYAARACEKGILRVCLMRIDGRAVAMQIAVETGNRLWLLKIGYDEEFAQCSPGMLLMLETLQYAERNGLTSYEFLGSAKEWTRRWTKDERNNITIRVYPYTLKGMGILVRDATGFMWRGIGRKFRAGK